VLVGPERASGESFSLDKDLHGCRQTGNGRRQILQSHAHASAEHDSGKGPRLRNQPRNTGRLSPQSRRVAVLTSLSENRRVLNSLPHLLFERCVL